MTASPSKKARRAAQGGRAGRAGVDAAQLKPFTVALVGRPNVGKSSLFNRLTGTRLAIVDDTPGTTRDWKEAPGAIGGLSFTVMDTGGLEDREGRNTIESRMLEHTRAALAHADVVLFIVDGRAGVSAADVAFARWVKRLRGGGARGVHLVANKTEGWAGAPDGEERWGGLLRECYPLGLGEPTPVSSSQGDGLEDLYHLLEPYGLVSGGAATEAVGSSAAAAAATTDSAKAAAHDDDGAAAATTAAVVETNVPVEPDDDDVDEDGAHLDAAATDGDMGSSADGTSSLPSDPAKRKMVLARLARESGPIQLAIVGRPNAGKSTLVNQLLG
jgi:GTPase